jgi:hypothetical protein
MWHILTHTTTQDNILQILQDGIISAEHYNFKKHNSIVYAFYLSSLIDSTKIKHWNFSLKRDDSVIIGFNPHILNNKKFVICDRRGAARCLKDKFKIVESHDPTNKKSKAIDFKLINNFINSRISNSIITNNKIYFYEILRNELIDKIYYILDTHYSYVDNKYHIINKNLEQYINKIKEIKNLPNNKIVDYYIKYSKDRYNSYKYRYDNDEAKYISSHEVIINGPINIVDINFIMISKNATNKFKSELKKVCPDYIKIIEIEPNDFKKYTKRIQKILAENSEKIDFENL